MTFAARFLALFTQNLLPMFLLIGTGYAIQRRFKLDITSLNKVNIYAFVPGLVLTKLLEANISLGQLSAVLFCYGTHTVLMLTLALVVCAKARRKGTEGPGNSVALSAAFPNTGNYGIPLMHMVFGAEGVVIQSIILMANNLLMYTVGLCLVAQQDSMVKTIRRIATMPVIYVLLVAGIIRGTGTVLPGPIMVYVRYLGDGLVPVALITLGAQLAATKIGADSHYVGLAVLLKLVCAPVAMVAVVYLFSRVGLVGWGSVAAKTLILGAGAPSAVNTVILSMEFKARPDLAAGSILVSTCLSAVTVTVLLMLVAP